MRCRMREQQGVRFAEGGRDDRCPAIPDSLPPQHRHLVRRRRHCQDCGVVTACLALLVATVQAAEERGVQVDLLDHCHSAPGLVPDEALQVLLQRHQPLAKRRRLIVRRHELGVIGTREPRTQIEQFLPDLLSLALNVVVVGQVVRDAVTIGPAERCRHALSPL